MSVDLINIAEKIERYIRKTSCVTDSRHLESYRFIETKDHRIEVWQVVSMGLGDANWYICVPGSGPREAGWVVDKKGKTLAEFILAYLRSLDV
jgi:hypothetical protein